MGAPQNEFWAAAADFDRTLATAIRAAGERRLDEEMFDDDTPPALGTDAAGEILLGHCHENALALGAELYARDIDCHVLWGAMQPPGEPRAETLEEASDLGCVHFWVEVPVETGPTRVADVAAEVPQHMGEPVLYHERPDCYIELPESRFAYSPSMSPRDLLPSKQSMFRKRFEPIS